MAGHIELDGPPRTNSAIAKPTSQSIHDAESTRTSSLDQPVPMSIPSLLINPKQVHPNPPRSTRNGLSAHAVATRALKPTERHIGRRKLMRRTNSMPTNHNPHAVRPRPIDYMPGYASQGAYKGTFPTPVPRYLREVGKGGEIKDGRDAREFRRELEQHQSLEAVSSHSRAARELRVGDKGLVEVADNGAASSTADSGLFTMSVTEARFFLVRRAGVMPRIVAQQARQGNGASTTSQSSGAPHLVAADKTHAADPLQDLVDRLEDEFEAWKSQVVYLPESSSASGYHSNTTQLNPSPKVVVPAPEDTVFAANGSSSARRDCAGRVEEHHHLPHSLSYLVPDAFDRLIVHCLARLWGLKSFSKPVTATSGIDAQETGVTKLTWILKPPTKQRGAVPTGGHRPNPFLVTAPLATSGAKIGATNGRTSSASADSPSAPLAQSGLGRVGRSAAGLDTPPTTDVGTSASEFEDDDSGSVYSEDLDAGFSGRLNDVPHDGELSAVVSDAEGEADLDPPGWHRSDRLSKPEHLRSTDDPDATLITDAGDQTFVTAPDADSSGVSQRFLALSLSGPGRAAPRQKQALLNGSPTLRGDEEDETGAADDEGDTSEGEGDGDGATSSEASSTFGGE